MLSLKSTMKENHEAVQKDWGNHPLLKNNFAVAVSAGDGEMHGDFIAVNDIFSTLFADIKGPRQLQQYVTSDTENRKVVTYNDGYWELLELSLGPEQTIHLLKNISYEMLILQKLKDQLRELAGSRALYSGIVHEDLPIGILIANDEYDVIFANKTLKRFFRLPPKANLKKCYNYVRELKPCEDCIIGRLRAGEKKSKKSFVGDGETLITAEGHVAGDKYVVIFRDTTREIGLIREIKVNQENLEKAHRKIAEQHDILKRLSNINIGIGQLRDLEAILEVVINSIIDTFTCSRGAILLFNRAGQIENAHFTPGVTDEEQESIIKHVAHLDKTPGNEAAGYEVMDMIDRDQVIGKVFLFRPEKTVDPSILELFLMQVSFYLENLKLQGKLEEAAHTDSLTGVFNRYYFDVQLKKVSEQSKRFGQPLSLIIVDVNGLKEANDRFGHEVGDILLRETAALLKRNTAVPDSIHSIFRVGGDEFVILLSNCPADRLEGAEATYKSMQTGAAVQSGECVLPVRFSLGGACSTETAHHKLMEAADKRMYRDKETYYKTHKKYR